MSLIQTVRRVAGGLVIVGGLFSQGAVTEAQMPMTRDPGHRVVFHLNSAEEQIQKGLLNNITNLYEALGPDFPGSRSSRMDRACRCWRRRAAGLPARWLG